jgi:hypothetical protein
VTTSFESCPRKNPSQNRDVERGYRAYLCAVAPTAFPLIDPKAGTVITNIGLGGKPEYGASVGNGKVYANRRSRA